MRVFCFACADAAAATVLVVDPLSDADVAVAARVVAIPSAASAVARKPVAALHTAVALAASNSCTVFALIYKRP